MPENLDQVRRDNSMYANEHQETAHPEGHNPSSMVSPKGFPLSEQAKIQQGPIFANTEHATRSRGLCCAASHAPTILLTKTALEDLSEKPIRNPDPWPELYRCLISSQSKASS